MRQSILLFTIVAMMLAASPSRAASFQGLGDLPGGSVWSIAYDISGDGSTVVGDSYSASGREAFRWTSSGGMQGLGSLPGGSFSSSAYGVSADGSVAVGRSSSMLAIEAYRWTASEGMQGLGTLGGEWSKAYGVSADGTVVVGTSLTVSAQEAFRWTESEGIQGIGDLPGGDFWSNGNGISADGLVVVGHSRSSSGDEAFRWTESAGMEGLGDLPGGGFNSYAYAASADGSIVVGVSWSEHGWKEAFRWTESEGMQGLGDLPGGDFYSEARAVSADGSIVVGESVVSLDGHYEDEAFIWDEHNGMRSIKEVLRREGLDMAGWTLHNATGTSADGLTIVGYGKNPAGNEEAWIATIPKPDSGERVGAEWVARYSGSEHMADWANSIAVDEDGYICVGGVSYKAPGDSGYLIIKYDPNGTELWSARYVGPVLGHNGVSALAVDDSGNVYVTGTMGGGGYGVCVTIKYDSNGNEVWVAKYDKGPDMSAAAHDIAVDAQRNTYITGLVYVDYGVTCLTIKYDPNGKEKWINTSNDFSIGRAIAVDDFGNVHVTGSIRDDYITIKYDANGNELWAATHDGGMGNWGGWDMVLGESGNVYITGATYGEDGSDKDDILTIKYDANGSEVWVRRYNGEYYKWEYGRKIRLDGAGNVYVGGCHTSQICPCCHPWNYLIVKYDANGNLMWSESYNGPAEGTNSLADMEVDHSGNVYVTGYSDDGSDINYVTVKYDTTGRRVWVESYDGRANGDDRATGIAVDGMGNVYVTGGSEDSGSDLDCATIKYSKCNQLGDIDCDRDVDFEDYAILGEYWWTSGCSKCGWADLDNDGDVDFNDLKKLVDNWLEGKS